jgi:hypothetical protein
MPKIRIYNRTKGSKLPAGVAIVVRAGATSSEGVFQGKPSELEVQVDKYVIYEPSSSTFRIVAEPKDQKIKAANFFPKKGAVTKDTDLYIVASNKDYVEISYDKPAG